MVSNILIVSEYLSSLKEDTELDYLFPIILNLMGFRIIATPKESKGQPQNGKDVIAIGIDREDGKKKRFYFELKGYADKDIDDSVLYKKDGIIESLRAAKYAIFKDSSVWGFNELPIKIVLVHNGVLKSNTRTAFEGLINAEFPDGNFERWDIRKLTDLFSQYLFGEYLLTDDESIRLFRRTLVLLDSSDYDLLDFKLLAENQLKKVSDIKSRSFKKFFASMNLLSVIIVHYARDNNNLEPAKKCLTHLVLKIWHWILQNKYHEKRPVIAEFKKILRIHFDLLGEYFRKTLSTACEPEGLFAERGGPFETIGYPLRSFEYINYLIYFFEARYYYPKFEEMNPIKTYRLKRKQKEILKNVLNNNIGCKRAILDRHLIPILNIFIFFFKDNRPSQSDIDFVHQYLVDLIDNMLITYQGHKRFPELKGNIQALIEFVTTKERPIEYEDRSSLLITILFEITAILDNKDIYDSYREGFNNKINLQTASSDLPNDELEILLFEKNLDDVYHVETNIELPADFEVFKENVKHKKLPKRVYQTDKAGLPFLRILAHVYFQNEWLPDEWRGFI